VDNVSRTVCINSKAAYAESVTVVLVLSISTRNADSLGTYQYCVGDWPDEMVLPDKVPGTASWVSV
jgi:hypothetical protein